MMEEKKAQLDKVRRAFRNPNLRGWIPRYLLTILEQGDDIEDTLSKMGQVMPKYCEPRKFATEELQSLNEGSEKQNDWRSLLVELSPVVRNFWVDRYNNYINPNGRYQALLGFADMRERYMGISHESSVQLLYGMEAHGYHVRLSVEHDYKPYVQPVSRCRQRSCQAGPGGGRPPSG